MDVRIAYNIGKKIAIRLGIGSFAPQRFRLQLTPAFDNSLGAPFHVEYIR